MFKRSSESKFMIKQIVEVSAGMFVIPNIDQRDLEKDTVYQVLHDDAYVLRVDDFSLVPYYGDELVEILPH